jgi:uncharacterized repeat protein (TIGR02543 family)
LTIREITPVYQTRQGSQHGIPKSPFVVSETNLKLIQDARVLSCSGFFRKLEAAIMFKPFETASGFSIARILKFLLFASLLAVAGNRAAGAPLFVDDFNRGIPGWTAVKPSGAYIDGPLLWQYDIVSGAFVEQSNIYTDNSASSATATAPMLINDTTTAGAFIFSARLTAGDDDGFGLIFGYQNETNFFRISFARQSRTGFPWTGWCVDRKVNGAPTNLFGAGTPGHVQTFVNTARPFDVTIVVDALNRLTLTVVDNPTGTPANYNLVSNQLLPASANGKVGMFTWGMGGGVPAGFRIQNVNLSPVALSGNPNGLTNWTALVPPRANGSTTVSGGKGQPFWSLGVGENGALPVLIEESDCVAGNDLAGQIDFTGPTLVAGSDTWTNYTVATRITPRDDDGHGILLRYKNATNFYRIALRSQSSTNGIPKGLSIQKNVNRVYSEVYRDNPVKYDPVADSPYDLVASISNNTLQVLVVADPEGAAEKFSYGPFTISGTAVNNGKIGLFSWGMSQTEFDFVTVQDGAPLYVSSPFGNPIPAKGLNSFTPGTVVNASAGPATNSATVRKSPNGWTGSGSVPTSGSGSNVTFTLNTFSELHWLWRTEYRLSVTNGMNGSVQFTPGDWVGEGTNVTLMAQPNAGFMFAGWLGDLISTSPTLNFTMDQPYTLVATFTADSDVDGLPDQWETAYFGGFLLPTPGEDPDQDGRTTLEEFLNGTNPTVADVFRITNLALTNNIGILTISNNSGTRYNLQMATNVNGMWSTIASTQFTYFATSAMPSGGRAFWRLQQPARAPEAMPFVPGSWTLAVLPDTQVYSAKYPEFYKDQTRWIVANKDRYNIKYVLHLGDIVDSPMSTNQWQNAKDAMSILDGEVPYAFATGNHDHGATGIGSDRVTLVNNYFPVSNYTNWPTFGGTMEPNKMENSYHLFSAGGVDWLVLSLEWGPRNSPVAWASQIVSNYPTRKAILITHAYMYFDETRYDWGTKGNSQQWSPYAYGTANDPDGTNDGEDLWRKLVKIHPNFTMVFNGHVLNDGLGRLSSTNDFGGVVHQMLVNYQMKTLGGEAFLRLVEFLPDGKTVQVKAYSPLYGVYKTDPQNQFVLTLDPPLQ